MKNTPSSRLSWKRARRADMIWISLTRSRLRLRLRLRLNGPAREEGKRSSSTRWPRCAGATEEEVRRLSLTRWPRCVGVAAAVVEDDAGARRW